MALSGTSKHIIPWECAVKVLIGLSKHFFVKTAMFYYIIKQSCHCTLIEHESTETPRRVPLECCLDSANAFSSRPTCLSRDIRQILSSYPAQARSLGVRDARMANGSGDQETRSVVGVWSAHGVQGYLSLSSCFYYIAVHFLTFCYTVLELSPFSSLLSAVL
jgi:hypothetical protein